MCRRIVLEVEWDDDHPEDVQDLFVDPEMNKLRPEVAVDLITLVEILCVAQVRVHVEPLHG